MSEEKLYVVKNDEGKYLDMNLIPWWNDKAGSAVEAIDLALSRAKHYDGHVIIFIEEPEKVALTKKQAEIVEGAHNDKYPTTYISNRTDDEELLMNAYVNGYTVAKEKKYLVYKKLGGKQNKDSYTGYAQACRSLSNSETMFWVLTKWIINDQSAKFTEKEITDCGLQGFEKEEVTDDEQ